MKCECGQRLSCMQSRSRPDNSVSRRYECKACGNRFSSKEIIVESKGRSYHLESILPVDLKKWKRELIEDLTAVINKKKTRDDL